MNLHVNSDHGPNDTPRDDHRSKSADEIDALNQRIAEGLAQAAAGECIPGDVALKITQERIRARRTAQRIA